MIRINPAFDGDGRNARVPRGIALVVLILSLVAALLATPVSALVIELDDVAPDRIERQRAFTRGTLPTAVSDIETLDQRLAEKGLAEGAPILIRIFKLESELELWMQKGDAFVLQGTYPICHWTGSLGPKLREGDKQSPEGFYAIGRQQMRHLGRWRQAFNLGFPNLFDKTLKRTGSYILVHGGCSSTGCYAMTGAAQQEIHQLAAAALRKGQDRFQVHIFPFRMTEANLAEHAASPWVEFWRDLKAGYDAFEQTRLPPSIGVCGRRYVVAAAESDELEDGPLTRIDPQKAAEWGFDAGKCQIGSPVAEVAAASDPASGNDRAATADGDEARSSRTVARVERREAAPEAPPAERRRAGRPKREMLSDRRARLQEKRRAHRAALAESYRRTLVDRKSGLGAQ